MKIKIKYLEENKGTNIIENKNNLSLYILGIRIKKIELDRKIHPNSNSKNKVTNTIFMIVKQIIKSMEKEEILKIVTKILKTIKVNKLDMEIGINFKDPIVNAYVIAIINSILPILIVKNNNNFNLDNIKYNTFISKKVIYLRINGIIHVSIVKNIISIIKIILVILKGGIKNGNKTSNRISNDNFNDFDRKYGRC